MQLKSNSPEIKWIVRNAAINTFARDMDARLRTTGTLTDNMIAAVNRIISEPPRENAQLDTAGMARISLAFRTAVGNGLKKPKMRLGDFLFSHQNSGRNAGSVYVKEGETYLGKITDEKFYPVRETTAEQKAAVIAVCADPKKAAEAYGQQTGRCSCCGRELTDPVSIANNIGPVCAENFGLA
jgi:hypothetical protein